MPHQNSSEAASGQNLQESSAVPPSASVDREVELLGARVEQSEGAIQGTWKVLVADADPEFHRLVQQALTDYRFKGNGVLLLSTSSYEEARALLRQHSDMAMALVEATLGTAHKGLELVNYVRQELGNQRIQLSLHIDNPGDISEQRIAETYDISDYHPRTELSVERLRTVVTNGLRAYHNLQNLASSRKGLARMMLATTGLLMLKNSEDLFSGLLPRLVGLLGGGSDVLLCIQDDTASGDNKYRIRAGIGRFAGLCGVELDSIGHAGALAALARLGDSCETILEDNFCALRLRTHSSVAGMIYAEGRYNASVQNWQLVELFRNKASIACESTLLFEEAAASQKATVMALAELAEYKDNAGEGHLQRIERLVSEVARELRRRGQFPDELDDDLVEKLGQASLLHDVGMISVSDETLSVPGELLEDDRQQIYRHTEVGYRILKSAAKPLRGRSLLAIAAEIAYSHHERYDGSGYPQALKGKAIHIGARITAVVDVFDALITERHYRRAWPAEHALMWMAERAGRDFDPVVMEAFLAVVRRIIVEDPSWLPSQDSGGSGLEGSAGKGLRGLLNRFRYRR